MITLKNGTTVLTVYAWQKEVQHVNRAMSTALDGTQYYQVFGSPYYDINIEGVCSDAEKLLIEAAEAAGASISCVSGETALYSGRIKELKFDDRTYVGLMKFSMTLIEEAGA